MSAPVPPAKPAHKTRGSYDHTSPHSVLSQPLPTPPSPAANPSSPVSNKQPVIPPVSQELRIT